MLPVLVGTAWASTAFHRFDGLLFGLALAATVFAHAATNVYNDVSDDLIGADVGNTDRIYPYTGGSRFIQAGLLSRAEMARLALGLCAASLLIGAVLAYVRGPGVILLGAAGLGLGLIYSLPGPQLSARGVGEAAVALGLGVLPVLGAVWLQTGLVDLNALLICIPVSCWVAAILIINEVPDMEADRRALKRTLVVRWGRHGRATHLSGAHFDRADCDGRSHHSPCAAAVVCNTIPRTGGIGGCSPRAACQWSAPHVRGSSRGLS